MIVKRGVIGVLSEGTRHLLVRRANTVTRPGLWCFPGGHLEPGETSSRAIVRELQEEIGIVVRPTERVGSVRLTEIGYILAVWCVRCISGVVRPAPAEIAEAGWFTPEEAMLLRPALPSNDAVLTMLKRKSELRASSVA
jgi:8-oxo-dGTP diphosphatase